MERGRGRSRNSGPREILLCKLQMEFINKIKLGVDSQRSEMRGLGKMTDFGALPSPLGLFWGCYRITVTKYRITPFSTAR